MQIKTILNNVRKFKSFVYGEIRLLKASGQPILEVDVHERSNSKVLCSVCGHPAPGYDRQCQRRFGFIPEWGVKVFLLYASRRVDCGNCGVKVDHMPWAVGKRSTTVNYVWYLAEWSKRISWQEVAEAFRTTWHHVLCSVVMAVTWGENGRIYRSLFPSGLMKYSGKKVISTPLSCVRLMMAITQYQRRSNPNTLFLITRFIVNDASPQLTRPRRTHRGRTISGC